MKKCLLVMISFLFVGTAFAAGVSGQTFKFRNQRGSTLSITKQQTGNNAGTITGTFSSAVASKDCQQMIGKPVPVTGVYNGNAIAFSINYPQCNTVVGMVGNFNGSNTIETIWIDNNQGSNTQGQDWDTRVIGHDEFQRVS